MCSESGIKTIRGVDGSWVKPEFLVIPPDKFTQWDISQPNLKDHIPEKHFDLAVSSEVAEHIEPSEADVFMDNLTSFSEVILFSAAIPEQKGTHHVNEQWPSYWIKKFDARGFVPIDCVRPLIWNDNNIRLDYRQNMFILVKKASLNKYPLLAKESDKPVFDVVHPQLWTIRLNEMTEDMKISNMNFRRVCKNMFLSLIYLIPSFLRAVKRRLA